jgi:hypothetical protein
MIASAQLTCHSRIRLAVNASGLSTMPQEPTYDQLVQRFKELEKDVAG